MSSNIVNRTAYLRTSRQFPLDPNMLIRELDKNYIDVANAVNSRIIGLFTLNRPSITGEGWFLTGQRQQTLRQLYSFTSTANITHGISTDSIRFTRMFGTYTDGTNWYGLLTTSSTVIAGQIGFYVTPTDIVFTTGGGAPTLTSGTIVLEWLAQV